MKHKVSKYIVAALSLATLSASTSYSASPFDDISRKHLNPMEVYGYYHHMKGSTDFGGGLTDSEKGNVGGVGVGINLTDTVNLWTELGGGALTTTPSFGGVPAPSFTTKVFDWRVGVDYNILKKRLTPVISGSLGYMNQSSDSGVFFSEQTYTFGGGAGLRWDVTDRIVAKAMYRVDWTSFEGSSSLTLYHGVSASLGWKF